MRKSGVKLSAVPEIRHQLIVDDFHTARWAMQCRTAALRGITRQSAATMHKSSLLVKLREFSHDHVAHCIFTLATRT